MSSKSHKNVVSLDMLKRYQSTLTKKILKKIGVNNLHTTDGWGWFVDPETNYVFNNTSKYNQNNKCKQLSILIPDTIQETQEYLEIRNSEIRNSGMRRSLRSINNFQDTDFQYTLNDVHFTDISAYNIVGLFVFVCLIYVFV